MIRRFVRRSAFPALLAGAACWLGACAPLPGPRPLEMTIFVATYRGGILRSLDGGLFWTPITEADSPLSGQFKVMCWLSDSELLVGTSGGGLFRVNVEDGGPRPLPGTENLAVRAILPGGIPGAPLLVATEAHGVVAVSADGSRWEPANRGLSCLDVRALAADVGDRRTVYGATASGLFRSRDWGGSWDRVPCQEPVRGLLCLEAKAGEPSTPLYAGASYAHGLPSLYVLQEGELVGVKGKGLPRGHVLALHWSDDAGKGMLYAGTSAGLFVTANGGRSWSFCGAAAGQAEVFSLTSVGEVLFVGSQSGLSRYEARDGSWFTLPLRAWLSSVTDIQSRRLPVSPLAPQASETAGRRDDTR